MEPNVGLVLFETMFQDGLFARKKSLYCIILSIHYSYYPIAVLAFCVHSEAPDGLYMTKRWLFAQPKH